MATNNPGNYIGVNGLVTQSYNQAYEEIVQYFRNIYGADINLEPNSSDANFLGILTQEKMDFLDLFTSLVNNLDVDTVVGLPQQILYKLNGLTIKAYTYSFVVVTVITSGPVTLQGLDNNIDNPDGVGYTVSDNNGNNWILANTAEITQAGTYSLSFRAEAIGDITALTNSITIMQTVLANVVSVNNPAPNYITGGTGETSSKFHQRRTQSMTAPSQGFDDALQGQLLALNNVSQAYVNSNRSNIIDQYGTPGHTLWVIVVGGSEEEIVQTIYHNVPPGIPMRGERSATFIRPNGQPALINYDIGQPISLYVRASIVNFSKFPLDETYIKQQLAQQTFNLYEKALNSSIISVLKTIVGEQGEPYSVELSKDNQTWAEYVQPSTPNQYFTIEPTNISLTFTTPTGA